MTRSTFFALALVATMATPTAEAATLRSHAILHGPTVRLSDLFDDLRPGQDCEIGPAPAPGKPLLVPSTQLAAIAGQFGVDWHAPDGYATASLERPVRLVTRDEIMAVLTPALVMNGMLPGSLVGLGVFAGPSLPADSKAAPEIQSLDYDAQTGRFSSILQFSGEEGNPQTIRIAGRVDQSVSALTPTHAIEAGRPITTTDVTMTRIQRASVRGPVLTDVAQAQGMVARQTLAAGMPILKDQLMRPLLVMRGRPVVLRLADGWLALTASGTALESGGAGDRIHVLNTSSHAVLVGQIVDAADIEIDPGTAPIFVSQSGGINGLPQVASIPSFAMPGSGLPAQEARYR